MENKDKSQEDVNNLLDESGLDFVDIRGGKHRLPLLSYRDLLEIERELGMTVLSNGINANTYTVWCSFRKIGLDKEQIKAKNWKVNYDDFIDDYLGGKHVTKMSKLSNTLMKLSGFILEEEKKDNSGNG